MAHLTTFDFYGRVSTSFVATMAADVWPLHMKPLGWDIVTAMHRFQCVDGRVCIVTDRDCALPLAEAITAVRRRSGFATSLKPS